MTEKRFYLTFVGVDGGPCPVCHLSGLLVSDKGVYGGDRTIRHTVPGGDHRDCTVPMSAGWIKISLDGVWTFLPHDSIPLSDQGLYHLSPGCRCSWASVGGEAGITEQHPECKIDHETEESR